MPGINWKYEASQAQLHRFWQGLREHYHQQGLVAPTGAACPYHSTSFAAIHWRRGQQEAERRD